MRRLISLRAGFLLVGLGFLLMACDLSTMLGAPGKPTVIIIGPASGTRISAGTEMAIQATATDAQGIVRIELLVDGTVVKTDALSSPTTSYTSIQRWVATTSGTHTIMVRAYNKMGVLADPATISIEVTPVAVTPSPVPSPTVTPTATPTLTPVPTPTRTPLPPTLTPTLAPNRISAFRANKVSARQSQVTVDYFYNGEWGADKVFLTAYAVSGSNARILEVWPNSQPIAPGTGTATIDLTAGDSGSYSSIKIVVCMYVEGSKTPQSFCQEFSHSENWFLRPSPTPKP